MKILDQFPKIQEIFSYSDNTIAKFRDLSEKQFKGREDLLVAIVGSFARKEASIKSDLDYFLIYKDDSAKSKYKEEDIDSISRIVCDLGLKQPSTGGAFGSAILEKDLLSNIGGSEDVNENLTRRMLFLLECDFAYNESFYIRLRADVIKEYVRESISDHQMCRFLLNDLIRYYRTVCVDFDYKVNFSEKSWGDRNLKLLFSRKFLYFSGLLVIAETVQHTGNIKRQKIEYYLNMPPLERVVTICGASSNKAVSLYENFLSNMSKSHVRSLLENTQEDRTTHTLEFRKLKNEGHHFTWELSRVLFEVYDQAHPIHLALKF